jgi:hypothetical protein
VLTSEGVASKEHVPHVRPREQTGGTALVSGNIQPHAVLTHQDGSCLKDLVIAIETWAVDVVVVSGPSQLPNLMPNAGAHLLPEAEARDERTLEAVRCSAWLGPYAADAAVQRAGIAVDTLSHPGSCLSSASGEPCTTGVAGYPDAGTTTPWPTRPDCCAWRSCS